MSVASTNNQQVGGNLARALAVAVLAALWLALWRPSQDLFTAIYLGLEALHKPSMHWTIAQISVAPALLKLTMILPFAYGLYRRFGVADNDPTDLRWALLVLGLPLMVGVLAGIAWATGLPIENTSVSSEVSTHKKLLEGGWIGPVILTSVLVVGLGPLLEELFFRRFLWGFLQPWGLPATLFVTSVLFGLAHQTNTPALMAFTMVSGAFFGFIRIKGGFWAAVLTHVLWNATAEASRWTTLLG